MFRSLLIAAGSLLVLAFATTADESHGELAKRLHDVKFERYAIAPRYSEGPTWLNGEVFFCSGKLLRVDAKGKVHQHLDLNPAGTLLRGNGHLLIADNRFKAIVNLSPEGKTTVVAEAWQNRPLRSLNDLTADKRGNIYWTDPDNSSMENRVGAIFRMLPDGRVDRLAADLAFPNGLDVDPASEFLLVIESQSKKVLRYKLPADDELLGKPEVFYDLGGSGGDGCTFDEQGNLWVTDFHRPETKLGRIVVLNKEAKVLAYLPLPTKVVSNICFGGPKGDEIFCTTGDPPGVFRAKVGVKGFAGHAVPQLPPGRELNVVVRREHAESGQLKLFIDIAVAQAGDRIVIDKDITDELVRLTKNFKNEVLRRKVLALLPSLSKATERHASDRKVLEEVNRLKGKATLEVLAPEWLRAIVGDDDLKPFARIVELDLNERTDGHKEPDKKLLSDRVTDEWLAKLKGQDALRRLELSGTAVTSAGMVHLADLKELQFLNICLTAIDDAGLQHFGAMTKVRRMTVCSSKITGSGFAALGGMKGLESINLHSSPASDAGLAAIGKLTSLKRLEIVHTHVTDFGLAHLSNLTNLRQLHVHGPEATEKGLPFLAKLTELYELDLYDRSASNESLAEIGKLPKLLMLRFYGGAADDSGVKSIAALATLEELVLSSEKITDASIDTLAGLKRLRSVQLSGTKITEAGKARLQAALPKAEIK